MWFADPHRKAFARLRLAGAPVVLGIRQHVVHWCLNGVMSDEANMMSLLRTWISKMEPTPSNLG
jgi:hypothetical protein